MKPQLGPEELQRGAYVSRLFARLEIPKRRKFQFKLKPSIWKRGGKLFVLLSITCSGWQRG